MARQDTRQRLTPLPAVAGRIREAQQAAEKTNAVVADGVGVDVRLYLKWKAGTVMPSYPNLAKLAAFYNRPVAWFFAGEAAA